MKNDLNNNEEIERAQASKLFKTNLQKNPWKTAKPDYSAKAPEGYTRLYHNTRRENLPSIYKHGLVMARPGGVRERKPGYTDAAEGDTIWAINNGSRDTNGYGGNTIAFDVPNTHKMEKVNDNEYILYEDVKPENFRFVDKVWGQGDRIDAGYRLSDLSDMVDTYKKQNKTKEQFKDTLNKYIPHTDYMDDAEFDYWIDQYWGEDEPKEKRMPKTYSNEQIQKGLETFKFDPDDPNARESFGLKELMNLGIIDKKTYMASAVKGLRNLKDLDEYVNGGGFMPEGVSEDLWDAWFYFLSLRSKIKGLKK